MRILEVIKIAFASLQTNKLRSALTILGIIVGIFSIIAISTVIEMLQKSIQEGVSLLGQNTFQIQKFPIFSTGPSDRSRFRNRPDITLEEYYQLKEKLVEAKSVGAELWNFGKIIKAGNRETNPNIQVAGATPEALPNNKWIVEEGRAFNERDVDRYENVAVLGSEIAKLLFPNYSAIDRVITLDGHKLKVIGILEPQGAAFGQSHDNFAVIPITTFQNYYGKNTSSVNITVMGYGKDSYNDLIEFATGYFRTIRKVPAWKPDNFEIFSNESMLTQINDITSGVRIGSVVIAGIALLAAGIGIMNIMLVSVTERTREIGIRKAVGAKNKNILIQFLSEAVTLCLFGGIVGIILGIAVGNLAGSFLKASAVIPLDWVVIGVLLCVIIGVGFGTYPAYKAANLDPIDALRYE